jgi:hypothetical protein
MTKHILSATALALLMGVAASSLDTALAQTGSEARSNDRTIQKKLDDRELTPIRPIRRVGEDSWPSAKNQPEPARETTGQSAADEKKDTKEDTAQNTTKPDAKRNPALGNQSPPPDKPEVKPLDAAKQPAEPKHDTAKTEEKQTPAKPDTKQAQQPAPQQDNKQNTAQAKDQQNKDQKNGKGFASIRLGTDEGGRVAVNEAQERQIASVMRKHRVDNVNIKVSVGSVAPANVRLAAVSSDFIDVFPQFRGYSYFATREEVVIIEPSSRKVIALIPIKTTATASRQNEERTTATRAETAAPPASRSTSRATVRERDVTVGSGVPSREEILAAPVARGPAGTTVTRTYRNYRYEPYDDDDDVVVIERRRPRFFPFW